MRINGFQKMTMLDYPQRLACTAFTPGCNLRCPFCHNARLVTHIDPEDAYTDEEIFAYLEKRRGLLDGICITGGEPLMQPDLPDFLRRVRTLSYDVKLDTNGTFPQKLQALVEEGLVNYVAMDIKNSPEHYARTVGVPDFDLTPIRKSAAYLMEGHVCYEFRTTVVEELHSLSDFTSIAQWLNGAENFYLQSFKNSGDLIDGDAFHEPQKAFLAAARDILLQGMKHVELRGV